MDMVARVERFPRDGETLTGRDFSTTPGGKGANQAVAAAKLGGRVRFIGCVGTDPFGGQLRDNLHRHGIDVSRVREQPDTATGIAVILVSDDAENRIILVPGTNNDVGTRDAEAIGSLPSDSQILLLQLEVPLEAVTRAAAAAASRGMTVILDPAPAVPIPDELLRLVHIVSPNQAEAEVLTGVRVTDADSARKAADRLISRGADQALIKLGRLGALWATPTEHQYFPAYPIDAVDTVAAGDAFIGAFACGLDQGMSMPDCLRWGLAAGAVCVSRPGAQHAMPTHGELIDFLDSQS